LVTFGAGAGIENCGCVYVAMQHDLSRLHQVQNRADAAEPRRKRLNIRQFMWCELVGVLILKVASGPNAAILLQQIVLYCGAA
jgi:hypothetical protein